MSIEPTDITKLPESSAPLDDLDEFILVDKSITQNELGELLEGGQPSKVTI